MKQSRIINLMVLLFALLYSAQAVTAESTKTTAKTTPQFIKDAVKPTATKNLVAPMLHKKKADTEKKAAPAKVVPKAIPKVVPKAVLKVVPQPAKKSSQPPVAAKKMPKPFDSRNAVKPVADAKIKAGSSRLKQADPPDRKPQPNIMIKSIPGVTGKRQANVRKKAVAPVGTVKSANPASKSGGFQGLAKSRGGVQATELESNITLPAVQKAHQPVKPLQIDPAGGVRVPISGGGAHLPPGVQLSNDAQASPGMQGAPPLELREGLVLARENLRADLEIIKIERIRSGVDRGKFAIHVKAIPEVAGNQVPLESFPIRLRESGSRGRIVWEGRGQIKSGFGLAGDIVVTSYDIVPTSRPMTLVAQVNWADMEDRYPESCPRERGCDYYQTDLIDNSYSVRIAPPTRSRPAGSAVAVSAAEVPEEIRHNNTDGSGDFETRITSFRVLRKRLGWVEFEVIYDLRESEPDRWLEPGIILKYGRRAIFDMSSTPHGERICSYNGAYPGHPGSFGQGRRFILSCRLASGVTAYSGQISAEFKRRDDDHPFTYKSLRYSLALPEGGSAPTHRRPDFDITSTRVSYREGKPDVLRVEVENLRHITSPEVINPLFVPILLKFKNQVDGVVARRYYRMRLDTRWRGRGRGTLRIRLAGGDAFEWRQEEARYSIGTIVVEANAIDSPERINEHNRSNNTARVEVSNYIPRYR